MPTTTSVVANKSTTLRNIVTVSSSWKQQTVVRSSGGVISPAVTTTSQSSNSNVQNIARISVAGATANASSSGITNNTNIPQEVHQVFRLKTKGGKIMYKSVSIHFIQFSVCDPIYLRVGFEPGLLVLSTFKREKNL